LLSVPAGQVLQPSIEAACKSIIILTKAVKYGGCPWLGKKKERPPDESGRWQFAA
jgi:hypothetical protein